MYRKGMCTLLRDCDYSDQHGGAPSTRLSAHALDMRAANARGLSRPAAFR